MDVMTTCIRLSDQTEDLESKGWLWIPLSKHSELPWLSPWRQLHWAWWTGAPCCQHSPSWCTWCGSLVNSHSLPSRMILAFSWSLLQLVANYTWMHYIFNFLQSFTTRGICGTFQNYASTPKHCDSSSDWPGYHQTYCQCPSFGYHQLRLAEQ